MKPITREMIVKGEKYHALPGQTYEIAKGVIATLKEDTPHNVDLINAVPRQVQAMDKEGQPLVKDGEAVMESRPIHDIALDQARIILDVPPTFDKWDQVYLKVIWRVCQDFLRLTLPTEQPED